MLSHNLPSHKIKITDEAISTQICRKLQIIHSFMQNALICGTVGTSGIAPGILIYFFLSFSENLMLGRSWGLWAGNNFEQSGDDKGKENSHYLQQSTASHDPRFPQEQESITESA